MKKLLAAVLSALMIVQMPVFAEGIERQDLKFAPVGGGRFIYCNNIEELKNDDLADDEENPTYIMNNENMMPDKYTMYVTHFNRTSKTIGENTYPGADIFVDVVFIAKEDTELLISKTAFEVPNNNSSFINYEKIQTEDSWSAIQACADMMGESIKTLHSNKQFSPKTQQPITVSVKKGEKFFLSRCIENYSAVAYPKHILMASDFEILSGKADINVFAARERTEKSSDAESFVEGSALGTEKSGAAASSAEGSALKIVEYPTVDFENCAFGSYKRDRTQKGIADSLPIVSADLEYTVCDSDADGKFFPVKVFNQYFPEGNGCLAWNTNLNPQEDTYSRNLTAESDILTLKYRDPKKKTYYGEEVPESEKDDVWVFDTLHSDLAEYDEASGFTEESFVPNYPLIQKKNNIGYACNLANYCVTLRYNLKINNSSDRDRYFDYIISSAANVIVRAADKDGNLLQPVISKGQTDLQTADIMASIRLAANETTEFSLEMLLPVQNYGGQRQQFQLSSKKTELNFENTAGVEAPKAVLCDTREQEQKEISALLANSDEKTRAVFSGNERDMRVVKTDGGYAAYNSAIDGNPYPYWFYWNVIGKIYLLDSGFNITKEIYLDSQPIEMTAAGQKVYVKTISKGCFSIDQDGNIAERQGYILPRDNGQNRAVRIVDGKIVVCADGGLTSQPVEYEKAMPPFVEMAGKLYYFAQENKFGVSADGVYWKYSDFDEQITSLSLSDNGITANGKHTLSPYSAKAPLVRINGTFMGFDTLPAESNGSLLVPMRTTLEKLGMQIFWNGEDKTITALNKNCYIKMTSGSDRAIVNGAEILMDSALIEKDGKTLVSLKFISEQLGFSESHSEENGVFDITGEVRGEIGKIETDGNFVMKSENGINAIEVK